MSASSEGGQVVASVVALPATVALHARPAATLVRAVARFDSSIVLHANGRRARAASILEVLALGVGEGGEVRLEASGDDAAEAVAELSALIAQLG